MNSAGKTIDKPLEKKNFNAAWKVLSEEVRYYYIETLLPRLQPCVFNKTTCSLSHEHANTCKIVMGRGVEFKCEKCVYMSGVKNGPNLCYVVIESFPRD